MVVLTSSQDPVDTVLVTLAREAGVVTALVAIAASVVIVDHTSSHDPTEAVLVTPASDVGVVIAVVAIAERVVIVDLTSSQGPAANVRIFRYLLTLNAINVRINAWELGANNTFPYRKSK